MTVIDKVPAATHDAYTDEDADESDSSTVNGNRDRHDRITITVKSENINRYVID